MSDNSQINPSERSTFLKLYEIREFIKQKGDNISFSNLKIETESDGTITRIFLVRNGIDLTTRKISFIRKPLKYSIYPNSLKESIIMVDDNIMTDFKEIYQEDFTLFKLSSDGGIFHQLETCEKYISMIHAEIKEI